MQKFIINFLLLTLIFPFPNNPPNAVTGAPGEGTCRNCHTSYPLNSGSGNVDILGIPDAIIPGETYQLQVKVSHPTLTRWGFEVTAKFSNNTQSGSFDITDDNHTISGIQSGITYIKQRSVGTFSGQAESATWDMDWTAPSIFPSDITFYAAGLTSNSANGNSGDYVYTTSFSTIEGEECEAGDFNEDGIINVLDIVQIVNYILGPDNGDAYCGDVNEDGTLNILDIVSIVNIILGN